jgi:hypothetical protein
MIFRIVGIALTILLWPGCIPFAFAANCGASNAPIAQGGALTSWVSGVDNLQHVAYIDTKGHVEELYVTIGAAGVTWASDDIGQAPTSAPNAQSGAITSWMSSSDNLQHIAYVGSNGHIIELYMHPGQPPWNFDDIGQAPTSAPNAQSGAITSWMSSSDNLQHIAYVGPNGHIIELYMQPGQPPWSVDDPTATSGSPGAQRGALTSWMSVADNTQHVVYIAGNGHVEELHLVIGAGGANWKFDDASAMASALQPDNAPPILIGSSVYIQPAWDSSGNSHFMLTRDNGQHWSDSFTLTVQPSGVVQVAGPADDPTLYLAVNRPCCTTNSEPRVGLIKIKNVLSPGGAVVSDVDSSTSGFGSLGFFPTMFAWYPVFGVDPNNPDHVLIADLENMQMRFTLNGGSNWKPDLTLTAFVTDNGNVSFARTNSMVVHAIGFDTSGTCDILVGTGQTGVFESTDHGQTWQPIAHTDLIGNLSRFYFPDLSRPIVVSSYGRGLWGLNIPRTSSCAPVPPVPPPAKRTVQGGPIFVNARTGARTPFRDIGHPEVCPRCLYIIVRYGRITDLQIRRGLVTKIYVSGGVIDEVDAQKRLVPLQIPNTYSVTIGNFSGNSIIRSLQKERTRIRGLVVEGDTLRGVLVSDAELAFQPSQVPYLKIFGKSMSAGPAGVTAGGEVRVLGEGFVPSGPQGKLVQVMLGSPTFAGGVKVVVEDVAVNEQGKFSVTFKAPDAIGVYDAIVEQQDGKRLLMTKAKVLVVPNDSAR